MCQCDYGYFQLRKLFVDEMRKLQRWHHSKTHQIIERVTCYGDCCIWFQIILVIRSNLSNPRVEVGAIADGYK